ncbi:MAG: M4 family metallopeptidase [Vicingaceae bacterium]
MKFTKYLFLFSCAFSLLLGKIAAQTISLNGVDADKKFKGAELVRYSVSDKLPVYVKFRNGEEPVKGSFIDDLKNTLKLDASIDFKLLSSKKDKLGYVHSKYMQVFNNIPYAYTSLMVHSLNDKVVSFNGNYINEIPTQTEIVLSFENAFELAKNEVDASEYYTIENSKNSEDLVYLKHTDKNGKFTLISCYRINIYAKEPLSRSLLFVNASNGNIEFEENLLHTGNSKGTAVTAYSDTQNIITDSLASTFRLVDTTRGNGVETYNCQTTKSYATAIDFIDSNNVWNNVNANLDEYATDAHWATEAMYDYLLSAHNYNSIDDSGFVLKTYIHYDNNYFNAFWDGQRMTYGDGNPSQNTTPLVTIDVVGHEIAHGLTEFSAGLIYANESGALNESFSDIFGTVLEFEARPNNANWTVGEDAGLTIRSMSNPKSLGDPDTYAGQNWIDQNCISSRSNDHCGVHTNSGVQNRWFYLITRGDTGVNDMADSFMVSGIGMTKAAEVAFRNLTVYLTPSSNYEDARFYSILSAIDLFGACSPEVETVTNAWYAVGVGDEYINNVSASFTAIYDTSYCTSNQTINFESTGSNVINFRWNFGNGDTSLLRNPSTTYSSFGSYDVRLIADGGTCGSDTILKTNYIELDSTIACAFTMTNDSNQSSQFCSGRLMDSGGINEEYTSDENRFFTIDVPSADFIELSFNDVNIETGSGFSCNKDFLEIFDGDNINAPIIGRYCNSNLPIGNKITSTTNKLLVRFNSDNSIVNSGFLLSWECKTATQIPAVDFTANTDTSCNGLVSFTNNTLNGANQFIWDFGDGKMSTESNPVHEYKANGNYSVKLVAVNAAGSDSLTKSSVVAVNRPVAPSVSNDTFCLGATAGIKVNSTETIEWFTDTTASSVFSGDSLTLFNLQADTTLYIREVSKEQRFSGGASLNNIGAGVYSNDNDYIEFDAHEAILIQSILFFSNEAGNRTLDIRNGNGQLVVSKQIYIPSSPLIVNVDIELQADTNYRISLSSKQGGLYKNTAGASFPYNISNLITLKGTNLSSGAYPYFYRWSVSKLSCVSNFKQVGATVDSLCGITRINENSLINEINVYPNPVNSNLMIRTSNADSNSGMELQLYSATGNLVFNQLNINGDKTFSINMQNFPTGVYYLKTILNGKINTHKIVKVD